MLACYKDIVLPAMVALSKRDAEIAHDAGLAMLKLIGHRPLRDLVSRFTRVRGIERTVCGIIFPNPVGIAAGFDKNATVPEGL